MLGSKERADELQRKLMKLDPNAKLICKEKQLNHYFIDGDEDKLFSLLAPKLSREEQEKLKKVIDQGTDFSIRTRLIDDKKLLFVIKASLDEGTSHNTVSRLEFETEMKDMTLDKLDQLLLDAGFQYQAKWSREREEYKSKGINVCFDKNAGYGYLAEFEKVVPDEKEASRARKDLKAFMDRLGVEELPQDRLERMFAHYNLHWPGYYGTDNIFVVE